MRVARICAFLCTFLTLSHQYAHSAETSSANAEPVKTLSSAEAAFESAMLVKNAQERLSALREVISAHPASLKAVEARYQIAECLRALERHQEALVEYGVLLQGPQKGASAAKINEAAASCMMAVGRYEESIEIIESGLSESPAYAQAKGMMLNLALCLEEIGQLPQARKTYADLRLQYPKTVEAEMAAMRLDDLSRPLLRATASHDPRTLAPAPFKPSRSPSNVLKSSPMGASPAAAFPESPTVPKIRGVGGSAKPPAAFPSAGRKTQPSAKKSKSEDGAKAPLAAFPD